MPYFVYKITSGSTGAIKDLEYVNIFNEFKQAKKFVREYRATEELNSRISVRMVFAENEFEAEQRLREPRNAPILKEWEK